MARPERVALVHERLDQDGGAERVLWSFHEMYPEAPIYTSMWNRKVVPQFEGCDVRLTWMQGLPLIARAPRAYAALYPIAFALLDLRGYDLVISLSSAFAKGIRTDPGALHVCYCFSPSNFVWRSSAYFTSGLRRALSRPLLAWLRLWEHWGALRPDAYVTMGAAVAGRIRRHYGRGAEVIPLGLDSVWFGPHLANEHFLLVSRLVEQKRIDLAIASCARAGVPLLIAGEGRDEPRLRRLSGAGVRFLGHISDRARLRELYARATAVIVPAEEDFGLVPLEAQAVGTPVVAYDAGGARDTVVDGVTGIRFAPQTDGALTEAIREAAARSWDHQAISRHAATFEQGAFKARFEALVDGLRPGRRPAGPSLAAEGGDAL
jgi:glycosyltransferase involved in cell wall biosynthesis